MFSGACSEMLGMGSSSGGPGQGPWEPAGAMAVAKPRGEQTLLSVQLFKGCVFSRVGAKCCVVGVVLFLFFFSFVVFLCAFLLRGGSFDMLL